jgi:hypothetical protein
VAIPSLCQTRSSQVVERVQRYGEVSRESAAYFYKSDSLLQALPDRGHPVGKFGIVHQHADIQAVAEPDQLLVEVAVIHVHMGQASQRSGGEGLHIRIGVAQVMTDVGARGQTGPPAQLPERNHQVAMDQRRLIRNRAVTEAVDRLAYIPVAHSLSSAVIVVISPGKRHQRPQCSRVSTLH